VRGPLLATPFKQAEDSDHLRVGSRRDGSKSSPGSLAALAVWSGNRDAMPHYVDNGTRLIEENAVAFQCSGKGLAIVECFDFLEPGGIRRFSVGPDVTPTTVIARPCEAFMKNIKVQIVPCVDRDPKEIYMCTEAGGLPDAGDSVAVVSCIEVSLLVNTLAVSVKVVVKAGLVAHRHALLLIIAAPCIAFPVEWEAAFEDVEPATLIVYHGPASVKPERGRIPVSVGRPTGRGDVVAAGGVGYRRQPWRMKLEYLAEAGLIERLAVEPVVCAVRCN